MERVGFWGLPPFASLSPCSALGMGSRLGNQSKALWGSLGRGPSVRQEQFQVGVTPFLSTALQGPLDTCLGPSCLRPCGRASGGPEAPSPALCCHHLFSPRSLDLTGPLLLGGVPDLPESFPVRMRHFVGCMRNLQVDSRHIDMADFIANNGTVPGMGARGGVRLGSQC